MSSIVLLFFLLMLLLRALVDAVAALEVLVEHWAAVAIDQTSATKAAAAMTGIMEGMRGGEREV